MTAVPALSDDAVAWVVKHLDNAVRLSRDESEEAATNFRVVFDVRPPVRASVIEMANCITHRGRAGRRRWNELRRSTESEEVLVVYLKACVGWRGVLRLGDDEALAAQSPVARYPDDLVVVGPQFEWAFVSNEHVGEALLQPRW